MFHLTVRNRPLDSGWARVADMSDYEPSMNLSMPSQNWPSRLRPGPCDGHQLLVTGWPIASRLPSLSLNHAARSPTPPLLG